MAEPNEAPAVRVLYGNSLNAEQRQRLARKVGEWMGSKGVIACVLCGKGDYNAEDLDTVFLPAITTGADVGRELRQARASTRGYDAHYLIREVREGLRRLRNDLRGFRYAAEHRQAVRLSCENCGHVVLLDSRKIGAVVEFIDPDRPPSS